MRAAVCARLDAAVSGPHGQNIESSFQFNVAIPGIGVHFAIQAASLDTSVPGPQADVPFQGSTLMLPSPLCRSTVPVKLLAFTEPSPVEMLMFPSTV